MKYLAFYDALQKRIPSLEMMRQEPMARHTTFHIGGCAQMLVYPSSIQELVDVLTLAGEEHVPSLILGKGSNLLVGDAGLTRLVVSTARLQSVEVDGTIIRAQAGVSLARLALQARDAGLTGLEFAHGIPGTLGGAVVMNAGAYGGEMSQVVESVQLWDPQQGLVSLSAQGLDFSYRHSLLHHRPELVVVSVTLRLCEGERTSIRQRMEELQRQRVDKQPLQYPSAGSTFKRPPGHFAAALIDQCGLKGYRIGGAEVSAKHAGFVVNVGDATCADVLALMRHVQEVVHCQTGVVLEPEVLYLEDQD